VAAVGWIFRVTRLGEFSPIEQMFTLGSYFEKAQFSQILGYFQGDQIGRIRPWAIVFFLLQK
jgi:hypothetical protein